MRTPFFLALAAAAMLSTPTLAAGPKAQAPKVKPTQGATAHGPSAKPTTTHGASAKAPTTHGPSTHAATAKGATVKTTAGSSASAKGASMKGAKPTKSGSTLASNKTTSTATSSTASTTTSTTSTSSTTWTPDNPVAEKLSTKSNLLSRVKNTLPAGTDLNLATAGFKNFGQFIAAVNVSNNLDIPFADLKAAMTGTTVAGDPTGKPVTSLGGAIRQLRGDVDPTTESQKAVAEADAQIGETSTKSTSTTPTTTSSTSTKKSPKASGQSAKVTR
jgi:hypothetical protein